MSINKNYIQELGSFIQNFHTDPGVNRDQTKMATACYQDGQWTRFDNGFPRKMGGTLLKIAGGAEGIVRAMYAVALGTTIRLFIFRDSGVQQLDVLADGTMTLAIDRTPVGWVPPGFNDPTLIFSIDLVNVFDTQTQTLFQFLVFVGMPNSEQITSQTLSKIYKGDILATTPFDYINEDSAGGIIFQAPYLFIYGNNGIIRFSTATDPFDFIDTNLVAVTTQKLIAARVNQGDGLVVWSSKTLYRVFYDTQINSFNSAVLVPKISLLSPSSIVEGRNNTFYWVGKKQFYVYNGVVKKIENPFNRNKFFAELDYKYSGKVWGMYVENYNEIWWFTPVKNSNGFKECAKMYNFDLDSGHWSDNILYRSCGLEADDFENPWLASCVEESQIPSAYQKSIWEHEYGGFDIRIKRGADDFSYPIQSYFQTKLFSAFTANPQINTGLRILRYDKDFIHEGDVKISMLAYDYPSSDGTIMNEQTITQSDKKIDFQDSGRFISFKFESNVVGGFYQFGQNILEYRLDGVTPASS